MLKPSITLGRIAGVEIGINWTWLIVFGLIVWSLAAEVFPATNPGLGAGVYIAMAVVASLLFFTSILLHELGHATQAKREGMQIEGITLWVFGGVARFSGMFPSAGAEFRIAIAGPLVTTAIAVGLLPIAILLGLPSAIDGVIMWLGRINLFLLGFNMLPAFPLDGGRVFRSLLWRWKGDFAWATHAAGRVGRGFGQLMIGFGVATTFLLAAPGGIWLALIGWFLIMAARAETQMVTMREAFAGLHVRDLMVPDPQVLPADATIRAAIERTFPPRRYTAYPVVDGTGLATGLFPFQRVATVAEDRWDDARVRDLMVPLSQAIVLDGEEDLGDAVAKLLQTHIGRGLVVREGRLEGILSITDVQRLLAVRTPPRMMSDRGRATTGKRPRVPRDTATMREAALVAMRDPALYGLPTTAEVDVRETHASIVFLAGERAYKVKKAVRLPFLDYGSLTRRHALCLEEVRLNRLYAPHTYIGVRAVVPAASGFALGGADEPDAVEYAVEMRRFDEDRTLERLVRAGLADEALIEQVARRVAELHATAPPAPPDARGAAKAWAPIEANLDVLRREAARGLDPAIVGAVARYAGAFAEANRKLMSARAAAGRVRDVHGDLRAEHVVAENDQEAGLMVVDRIEFDERLRQIDVASDLAFLVMDLEHLGARELGRLLVRTYVAISGDAGVRDLLPFYASYRAAVRAKVACVRAGQLDPSARERAETLREARTLLELALRFAWRSRLPLALVFCGVAGSGKSTLAVEVARRSGLRRVSSDEVRKQLVGLAPTDRASAKLYSEEHTEHTYARLLRESQAVLLGDGGVIIDATFHERRRRLALSDALRATGARILFCECRAPEETLQRRGRARERAPELGSDAAWHVIANQLTSFEPLDEAPPADHLVIDTGRSIGESLAELEEAVSDAIDRVPRGARPVEALNSP